MVDEAFRIGAGRGEGLGAEARVFVIECTTGKLLKSVGVNGVVLPVTVTTDIVDASELFGGEPFEETFDFVLEAAERGVVVDFDGVVWTQEGGGVDDDFPRSIRFL